MSDNRPIYIEATAPGRGDGPDAVPIQPPDMVVREVPESRIVLRLRGAIKEKLRQYRAWKEKGIVDNSSPYIIAINGRRIPEAIGDSDPPFIVKSVFPFGGYTVLWNKTTRKIAGGFHERRDRIGKVAGGSVNTDLFESGEYGELSAVLYANCDCANHAANIGDDFTVVHNPLALNKIPPGFFPFGREYTSDDENLYRRDW